MYVCMYIYIYIYIHVYIYIYIYICIIYIYKHTHKYSHTHTHTRIIYAIWFFQNLSAIAYIRKVILYMKKSHTVYTIYVTFQNLWNLCAMAGALRPNVEKVCKGVYSGLFCNCIRSPLPLGLFWHWHGAKASIQVCMCQKRPSLVAT
jgi:hypothetical protein